MPVGLVSGDCGQAGSAAAFRSALTSGVGTDGSAWGGAWPRGPSALAGAGVATVHLPLAEVQGLQAKELKAITAQVQAKLQATFKQLDTNKDGQLSFAEFAATAGGIKANETPQQVLQKIDLNHDGKISAAEFKAPRLGAFDKIDANHDGVITADEARRASSQK